MKVVSTRLPSRKTFIISLRISDNVISDHFIFYSWVVYFFFWNEKYFCWCKFLIKFKYFKICHFKLIECFLHVHSMHSIRLIVMKILLSCVACNCLKPAGAAGAGSIPGHYRYLYISIWTIIFFWSVGQSLCVSLTVPQRVR